LSERIIEKRKRAFFERGKSDEGKEAEGHWWPFMKINGHQGKMGCNRENNNCKAIELN